MPRISLRRACLGTALILSLAAPAGAAAKPRTHVFKMDLTVTVSTEWASSSENQVCSDWRRILMGDGVQHLSMEAKRRLVTFRAGKLAYPGTKGTMSFPVPRAGSLTLFPLSGTVTRKAAYELTHTGKGETCVPGFNDTELPSTRTCGQRPTKGGLYGLLPGAGTLKLVSMNLLDDPFEGECPAESSAAAITLPEPVEITHGKDALKQLANPRVKKVVVQGSGYDIKTEEPWGMGDTRAGEQTSDVLWYATFRRVG